MNTENKTLVPVNEKTKKYQLLKNAAYVGGVTAMTAFAMPSAYAAGMEDVGNALKEELTSAKTMLTTLFVAGALVLGFLAAWRYLKRGINSI